MLYDVVMGHFISRWLILTVAAGVMVAVLPGMHAIGEPPVLGIAAFALFMALINASIKPIIHVIALPFSIVSFRTGRTGDQLAVHAACVMVGAVVFLCGRHY